MQGKSGVLGCLLILFTLALGSAHAAAPVVLSIDLPALITRAAAEPERFAVQVPQQISVASQGQWTSAGSRRTWMYAVQVPTAVSMSFHATRLTLPSSAVLTVSGARATIQYRARDVGHGSLWSRPLLGDSVTLSLSVDAGEARGVQLQIDSLQAGYRGLGGAPNHPAYLRLLGRAAAAAAQSCTENYACDATTANQAPSRSIVAILIGNEYQCTGTLLNNTQGDQTPYILTARHCQNGALGGGAPNAAASVSVYWDAVTPCGQPLGSIYDGSAPAQSFATTIVEQQDAWLIKLADPPVVNDAFWAGWDATGGTFNGGYSIHHAMGFNKQYVAWYGQALLQHIPAKTLSVGYDSTFWGVVNQLGSVGAGASGGALFDPDNRLVGSASLAALQNGENSAGVCPVNPPPAPAANTVTAQYTALSGVFASTADSTSSTGGITLQSVLDPAASGKLVADGVGNLPVTLTADQTSPTTFDTLTLSWSAPGAQTCTASGGTSGDGWAGLKPATGTAKLANFAGGNVTYTLSCSSGDLSGSASTTVQWLYVAPNVSLNTDSTTVLVGSTITLFWSATYALPSCTASGGVAGDGWAGTKANTGQQNVVTTQVGTVTYNITCGSPPQSASTQLVVTVLPVSVSVTADSTKVRVGSDVLLTWTSPGAGGSCLGTGGSLANGWKVPLSAQGTIYAVEQTAGTYTYTITCTGGGQTASSSVTVIFTNDAAAISISAVSPTQQVYPPSGFTPTIDLNWTSNVTGCFLAALGPLGNTGVTLSGKYPGGTATDAEYIAGHYVYQLTCGALKATTAIDWTTSAPAVTLNTVPALMTTWVAGQQYQLFWTTNTTPCTQTGGAPGDGWAGSYTAGQASQNVTEAAPGNYTFTLTCGTGTSSASAKLTVTVPAATVSITASPTTVSTSQTFALTFNTTVLPCTSVDATGINWGGVLTAGSTYTITPPQTPGTYTYAVNCGTGSQAVRAATQVKVVATAPTTVSASASSVVVNTPVTITWNSGQPYCITSGGTGSDGWQGTQATSGNVVVTSSQASTVTYVVTCGVQTAQTQVTYSAPANAPPPGPDPAVTLKSNATTQAVGKSVTLTWSSQNASACTPSGGSSDDSWTGSLALSGSMEVIESTAGNYTYGITCSGAPPAATANVKVDFTDSSASGSTSGSTTTSGGGGGGSADPWWLALLSCVLFVQCRRRGTGEKSVRDTRAPRVMH